MYRNKAIQRLMQLKPNKKIKRTDKSVTNFAIRKICAPFIRRLFWRWTKPLSRQKKQVRSMNKIPLDS